MPSAKTANKPKNKQETKPAPAPAPKQIPFEIERIPTGIPGLDGLMEGGFVKGSTVLVSGGTGTGKTIFSLQYLWEGVNKHKESALHITFEETQDEIIQDTRRFGWDLQSAIDTKKLIIHYLEPYTFAEFADVITELVKRIDAKRLTLDSTSIFGMYLSDEHEVRSKLYELTRLVKKLGCTTILTADILEESAGLSRFGVEEFVTDGVLTLHYMGIGQEFHRGIAIRKMRSTCHSEDVHPLKITNKGMVISKREDMYKLE